MKYISILIFLFIVIIPCADARSIDVMIIGDSTIDSNCETSPSVFTGSAAQMLFAVPPSGVTFVGNSGFTGSAICANGIGGAVIPNWDTADPNDASLCTWGCGNGCMTKKGCITTSGAQYIMIVSIGGNDISYHLITNNYTNNQLGDHFYAHDCDDATGITTNTSFEIYGNSVEAVYRRGIDFFQYLIGAGYKIIYVSEYPCDSDGGKGGAVWGNLGEGCNSMMYTGGDVFNQYPWNSCYEMLADRWGKWLRANGQHYWDFLHYCVVDDDHDGNFAEEQDTFETTYLGADGVHMNNDGHLLLYNFLKDRLESLTR